MLQNVVEKLILGGKQMKKTKMLVSNDTTEGKSIGLTITYEWQQFNR